jgi:phospholipid/cholesterol/gamma-HCH transport system substrate-binding protein
MSGVRPTAIKFTAFAAVMVLVLVFVFFIFGQYRTGSTAAYSAEFADVSRLQAGDSVRVAGIRVGTVEKVALRSDGNVVVGFDVDRSVALTEGSRAAVRYLNLVGARYLELVDGAGSTRLLSPGSQIPLKRTAPALDLDLLLRGLKPVVAGLNPQDVNALSASLLEVLQGQGGTLQSLLSKTSSFTASLADNRQAVERVIDNLDTVLKTLGDKGDRFSAAIDGFERLTTGLAADRDPIGAAIESLDRGTASLAELLTNARSPLAGTINQLNRLAPVLVAGKDGLDATLGRAPDNYRKLDRVQSYGAFINVYFCGISFRASDLQGRTVVAPWIKQTTGRCAEP